jgi:hypothetical protein
MILDIKPMILPPGKVGGEFVREIFVAGLLSQLDAGTPHNGKILCCGLWFDVEEEAEKIPVGFDSEESFTEIDENWNVADGIRVEMMKLKPVEIQKASEQGTSGEGQSPFGKMEKCDDFNNIFHGERFTVRGRQLTRFFSCSNPSETRLFRLLREHLLCVHSAVEGCASFFFPLISAFLGTISDSLAMRSSGAAGRGAGRLEREDFFGWMAAALGPDWGFWRFLAKCRLEAQYFPTIVAGLNNQRGREKLPFRRWGVIWWIVWIKYLINHFFRAN